MPRKFFRRITPSPETVRQHRSLQILGTLLHDPHIWHLTRHSVSTAFFVGLFLAFVPVPIQMVLAALISIPTRANLPIAVALVWITNPITIPPMFFGAYKVGVFLLGHEATHIEIEMSWQWLTTVLASNWQPFLLGCLICGLVSGLIGSFTVRILWRLHVIQRWKKRTILRRNA